MPAQALLEVTHYETQACLGWTDEERAIPQNIALDITLHYQKLPQGCQSDELLDTQCYAQVISWAEHTCQSGSFKLLEHLAYQIHTALKQHLQHLSATLSIRVTKLTPPVEGLRSASFTVRDL